VEERKAEGGIRGDGDAQKPAEGPRHQFMSFRHNEFGELQAD
jgi:hypothetical protein